MQAIVLYFSEHGTFYSYSSILIPLSPFLFFTPKGSKAAKPSEAGVKVCTNANTNTGGVGGDVKRASDQAAALRMDMKTVTMTVADSKEVTPRGTSAKVREIMRI